MTALVLSTLNMKLPSLWRFPMPHASFLQGVNSIWCNPRNWFGAVEILVLRV